MTTETRSSNRGRSRSCSEAGAYRYRVLLAPVSSSSRSRSQPSALWAITGSPNTSRRVSAVPYTLPMVFSGRLVQAAQASRAWELPISIRAWATSSTSWTSTHLATSAMLRPVAADVGGVGEHAADAPCIAVGGAVGQGGPAGAGDAGEAEGVVDPDGAEAGPVGAGGPQHIRLDGGGDQVALPLQDGWDDQPVGLERPWWAEGQDRVALLDGQIQ